jgi:hypothetical protein
MRRAKQMQRRKRIQSWKGAKPLLERWRKNLVNVQVELKQPRVIDVAPIDFVSGDSTEREGIPRKRFRRQLIYITNDDVTIRRPSGAVLVIDNYEVVAISEGKTRLEPR